MISTIGGSIGAFLPGLTWETWGWPAVIAEMIAVLCVIALVMIAGLSATLYSLKHKQ